MKPRVIFGTGRDEGKEKCQRKEGGYAAILYGPVTLARDRRLGKVRMFPCQTAFEVSSGGDKFLTVDYASAGKHGTGRARWRHGCPSVKERCFRKGNLLEIETGILF